MAKAEERDRKQSFPRELLDQPPSARLDYFKAYTVAHPFLERADAKVRSTLREPGGALLILIIGRLREEALFRGVILQALLPYGWLRAAALSALFFGLFHLSNLLVYPSWLVLVQVFSVFLFGFGYAACRLRTNTIWPLIIIHACSDLFPISTALNGGIVPAIYGSSWYAIVGTVFNLVLAGYGLFLLRPRRQPAPHLETLSEQ